MDWEDRKSELNEKQVQLVDMLALMRKLRKSKMPQPPCDIVYAGMQDFLLQHGEWYTPKPWNFKYVQGAPRSCYANALSLGISKGLRYVEGVALVHDLPMEFQHAWNTNDKRELIDNTWLNLGQAYLGVEFSLGRADHCTWEDDATVLDNPSNRFAIFREPWKGEDFSKVWPKSDGWKALETAHRYASMMEETVGSMG